MANRPLIDVNLVIVATLGRLITPEVNLVVLILDELEAEGLVPAHREDIKRDLATDGEPQIKVGELGSESLYHSLAHARLPIELLEGVPLGLGAVAADRAHINHAVAELNESPPV